MEPFKKYITCIMVFFTPFNFVTLCQSCSITYPALFTKLHWETVEWEKRRFFAYMATSPYHVISKEVKNRIFRQNWISRHTCMYRQLTLTELESYNIFVQIWCSLFRYTGKLFFGCALFVAHSNIIRASWETTTERLRCRKMHSRICVRNITFLTARPPFYFNFLLLSLSTLSPVKIYNIAMAGILHDDTMSERLKIWQFLAI